MAFLYLTILFLPNIIYAIIGGENSLVIVIFFPLVLISSLFSIFPRFTQWLAIFLSPWALLESFYIAKYARPSDEHIYAIAQETNFSEAAAWLGFEGLLFLMLAIVLLVAGFFYRKPAPFFPMRWKFILFISSGVLAASVFLPDAIDFSTDAMAKEKVDSAQSTSEQLIGEFKKSPIDDYFPWGLPFRVKRYFELQQGMKSAQNSLQNFHFGAIQLPGRAEDQEVYVLVIGETGRPDRWQLNGHTRETNPLLSRQKNFVSFTNVTTGWAWTRMSVPVMISRKPPQMQSSFFPEKSIVSVFKEAGFWTAWYSTQGSLGFHESAVALHASEANDVQYVNPAGYRSPGVYDGRLLDLLKIALGRPEKKKFIVLHTLGGHYNYSHRSPPDFDIFTPVLRNNRSASLHDKKLKQELNNSYDNSIVYTDFFLNSVVNHLKNNNSLAALLYAADHGENIFDGDCDKSGHGHNTEFDYRISAAWWNSDSFGEKFPAKVAAARAMKNQAWSTQNIFETLAGAADIEIANQPRHGASILSENFQPMPRWVQSGLIFDQAARTGACKVLTHAPHSS